jgi:hypothetical protein
MKLIIIGLLPLMDTVTFASIDFTTKARPRGRGDGRLEAAHEGRTTSH